MEDWEMWGFQVQNPAYWSVGVCRNGLRQERS